MKIIGKTYVYPDIKKFFREYPFLKKYCKEEKIYSANAFIAKRPSFFSDGDLYCDILLDKEGNFLTEILCLKKPILHKGNSKLCKWLSNFPLFRKYEYFLDNLNGALAYLGEKAELAYMVLHIYQGSLKLYFAPNGMSFKEWGDKLLAESEKS